MILYWKLALRLINMPNIMKDIRNDWIMNYPPYQDSLGEA